MKIKKKENNKYIQKIYKKKIQKYRNKRIEKKEKFFFLKINKAIIFFFH